MSLARRIARANRPKKKAVRLNRLERLEELMLRSTPAELDKLAHTAARHGDHETVRMVAAYKAEQTAQVLGIETQPEKPPEPAAKFTCGGQFHGWHCDGCHGMVLAGPDDEAPSTCPRCGATRRSLEPGGFDGIDLTVSSVDAERGLVTLATESR